MTTANEALLQALRDYRQADEDGVMVIVSRQACDEAAAFIERALQSAPRAVPPRDVRIVCYDCHGSKASKQTTDGTCGTCFGHGYVIVEAAPEAPLPGQSAEAYRVNDDAQLVADLKAVIEQAYTGDAKRLVNVLDSATIMNIVLSITEGSDVIDKAIARASTPSPAGQQGEAMRERDIEAANRQAMFFDWCALLGFGIQGWPEEAANQLRAHFREMWNRALRASAQPTPPMDDDDLRQWIGETVSRAVVLQRPVTELVDTLVAMWQAPAPAAMAELAKALPLIIEICDAAFHIVDDSEVDNGETDTPVFTVDLTRLRKAVEAAEIAEAYIHGDPDDDDVLRRVLSHPSAMAEAKGEVTRCECKGSMHAINGICQKCGGSIERAK